MNREKVVCEVCEGKGYENNCPTCYGSNSVPRDVKESIYIEKGTQDKTILKIENGGHCGYKHSNGDLYVTVFVEKSDYFRIDGTEYVKQGTMCTLS